MSDFIGVDINRADVRRTIDELRELESTLSEKSIRTVLRNAAKPMVLAMKSAAPGKSLLKDSINAKQVKDGDVVRTGSGERALTFGNEEYGIIVGPNVGTKSSVTTVSSSFGNFDLKVTRRFKMAKPVAMWLEHGTSAHTIKPKRGKSLYINGNWVGHPVKTRGIRARHWMRNAAQFAASAVDSQFYTSLSKELDKYGR